MKEKILHILKITGCVLLTIVLIGYALFAGIMSHLWRKDAVCNQIEINVHDYDKYTFICENDILKHITKNHLNPIGSSFDSRKADIIEKSVSRINVVKNVECYITNRNTVIIDVTQREPVYRVITGHKNYYVDKDRRTLKSGKTFATLLPIVTGYISEEEACGKVYDFVTTIHNHPFWGNHIGQINFTKTGTIELITKIGAKKIIIDNLDTYQQKLDIAEKWYAQYPNVAWSNLYTQVDLRYNNLIYCKKGDSNE